MLGCKRKRNIAESSPAKFKLRVYSGKVYIEYLGTGGSLVTTSIGAGNALTGLFCHVIVTNPGRFGEFENMYLLVL